MIKNVVIHFSGRLPLVADLADLPGATDASVLATNLRTKDGKRPTFAESPESWFLIPLREVFVMELPASAGERIMGRRPPADSVPAGSRLALAAQPDPFAEHVLEMPPPEPVDTAPLEPDEDLLARIRQL